MSPSKRSPAAIFESALALPPDQRPAYLDTACVGDEALRGRVEALLQAHEEAGAFMEGSATPRPPHPSTPGAGDAVAASGLGPDGPGSAARADPAVGQSIGRYKLLERIGEGGCGVVYVAEQREPVRRRVALKVIKLGMDTKAVIARFEAERQALAMMDHPHIAKVFDAGTTERGSPYFVMELVRGLSLTDYCDQANLTTRERLELFIQVCQAVQHAHQKGVIHRDLKPSNILVTLRDGVPVPKVIDFGIAKAVEGRLTEHTVYTQLHQFIGTPAYMSPEQAEMTGLDIDTRTDIYSLGVLLYELLAGSTPFDAKELMAAGLDAMRKIIREQEPLKPSTRLTRQLSTVAASRHRASTGTSASSVEPLSPVRLPNGAGDHGAKVSPDALGERCYEELRERIRSLQGDLDWIVMKCLEKDRRRRYETANGLAFDIRRHLHDEPVLARPPSAAYRFQKAIRRHKLVFTAAGITAIALVAGIGVSLWQTFAAHSAEHETERARLRAVEAARRAEGTLEVMQIQKAEDLFAAQEPSLGVAYLGRVLRANPSNEVAAARLASAILRPFPKGLTGPLQHEERVTSAEFSPDGSLVLTVCENWTARIWDARTGELVNELPRQRRGVISAQFSPDGSRVVTACSDSTARIWDARTGRPLTDPLPHGNLVHGACFSPDGLQVVTASGDKTARVWDARTGQPLTGPLPHGSGLHSARFSPDGLRVVTASEDQTAQVWDARTGQPVGERLRHGGSVLAAEFSPSGSWVVTASLDGTAQVWDARTGRALGEPLRHAGWVTSAEFSPNGLHVATASGDGTARVWDARTGRALTGPLRHGGSVGSARFSPDGLRVVTGSDDSTARVWDARTGEPLTEPLPHEGNVSAANFSPDGLRVVTACSDHTARIWDAGNSPPLARPLRHELWVRSARFSPDGGRVVTASGDNTARLWDADTGQPVTEPLRHQGQLRSAEFSPNGLWVLTASDDHTARVWDAGTGQPLTEPLRHEREVTFAQFSPDGLRVVTSSEDCTARVWDAHTERAVTEPIEPGGTVASASFSPDGRRVVTAATGVSAQVWDARSGQPLTQRLLHKGFVVSAQFSPDGSRVVTASHDHTAQVWEAHTGQPVSSPLRHKNRVQSAQFSPDGLWVVTASVDHTARVWDARTGQPLTEPLRHAGPVNSARFSPDGRRVVTASEDQTARVWDARTGQPMSEPLPHRGPVNSAEFSPDGLRVVTASNDKTARVWEAIPSGLTVPGWFLDWAETRVGRRFGATGEATVIPLAEQRRQAEQVRSRTDTGFFTRLAQWVEANPSQRTVSPFSSLTMAEHVRQRVQENTLDSLYEAVRLDAGNGLALARLGRAILAQPEADNPRRDVEAAWFTLSAVQCAPRDPEVWRLRSEVLEEQGRHEEAVEAQGHRLALLSEKPATEPHEDNRNQGDVRR